MVKLSACDARAAGHMVLRMPPAQAPLTSGEVVVWRVPLDRWSSPALGETLSADERGRAALIRLPARREEFVAAHAALRAILASYQDIPPESVLFTTICAWCGDPEHGKPRLQDSGGLNFNLTRAGSLALVAVALDAEVGVDAEPLDRAVDWRAIGRRALSPDERAQVQAAEPGLRASLSGRLWCRKEAVAKATGLGLALNLKTWTARPDGRSRWLAASLDEMPEPVLVSDLDTVTDAFAAVAVTGAGEAPTVTVRDAVPG
jgi:4'-phosphopantetheinyl transferase